MKQTSPKCLNLCFLYYKTSNPIRMFFYNHISGSDLIVLFDILYEVVSEEREDY